MAESTLKPEVIVPPKAVFNDELDEEQHYVWLVGKDGKPQKRAVKLGEKRIALLLERIQFKRMGGNELLDASVRKYIIFIQQGI